MQQLELIPDLPEALKLDLGCGGNKKQGFVGVDIRPVPGVDIVTDLSTPWPWGDNSVEEIYCSHFVEHLDRKGRIHFVNELYRVLVPGEWKDGQPLRGFATVITPHWASSRAYGDLTHEWPPVSEFWFYYLSREWRTINAPHNSAYICNFDVRWGYNIRDDLKTRNTDFQQFALSNYKETAQDIIARFVKCL